MSTESQIASWVPYALSTAAYSPCQSKRGVVIASADNRFISHGYNHQPGPFECDGSDRCKRNCGKTAIHAEQAAIIAALERLAGSWMLHVKMRDNKPCASMAPSCLECSKLILVSGIAWMHLIHDPTAQMLPGAEVVGAVEGFASDGHLGMLDIRRYSAQRFHWLTAEYWHHIRLICSNPALSPEKEVAR